MNTMFENLDIWKGDKTFIIACRDREATSEERWVLASLSNTEARKLYEYLQKHLK